MSEVIEVDVNNVNNVNMYYLKKNLSLEVNDYLLQTLIII